MNGIAEILASGQFPSVMFRDGKTEQRKCEDENAKKLLKGCRELEEKDTHFMRGSGMSERAVLDVWRADLGDPRKNSITDRYDERVARAEETAEKVEASE